MSADALYREMGLEGYRVEDTRRGNDGAVYVSISFPRESLCAQYSPATFTRRIMAASPGRNRTQPSGTVMTLTSAA